MMMNNQIHKPEIESFQLPFEDEQGDWKPSLEDRVTQLEESHWQTSVDVTREMAQIKAEQRALRKSEKELVKRALEEALGGGKLVNVIPNTQSWYFLKKSSILHSKVFVREQEQTIKSCLLKTREILAKLEEDFEDPSRRIVWSNSLEKQLSFLDELVDENNAKYLSWSICTVIDSLKYNYVEILTYEQFSAIKASILLICEKQETLGIEIFENIYSSLLQSGLSLLPTTEKIIKSIKE